MTALIQKFDDETVKHRKRKGKASSKPFVIVCRIKPERLNNNSFFKRLGWDKWRTWSRYRTDEGRTQALKTLNNKKDGFEYRLKEDVNATD